MAVIKVNNVTTSIKPIIGQAKSWDNETTKLKPIPKFTKPVTNEFTPYTNEEIGRLQHATRIPIKGSLTGMEDKVRQNTEYALNKNAGTYGFMEGFNPLSAKRQLERNIGQPIDTSKAENSGAYKVGYGAGLMGQYMTTGGVAHGAVRGGITKAIPKLAQNATRTQKVLGTMGASALTDVLTGVPINTVQAIKESSTDDKVDWGKFAKSFAVNTAIDVVFGGLIEGGIALKSGKKVKTVGDLANLTKAEADEVTEKLLMLPEPKGESKMVPENSIIAGSPVPRKFTAPTKQEAIKELSTRAERMSPQNELRKTIGNEIERIRLMSDEQWKAYAEQVDYGKYIADFSPQGTPLEFRTKLSATDPDIIQNGAKPTELPNNTPQTGIPVRADESGNIIAPKPKSIPVKVNEPKVQSVKPSKSIKDLPEDVQKEYTTFEANEGGFAGQPAEGFGLGELSVNVSNAHVRNTNSVSVNADFALGKNTPEREIFKEQIEKPFAQSKGQYVASVKKEVGNVNSIIKEQLGIKQNSKESAGVQWLGEGKKVISDGNVMQEVDYTLADLMNEFDYAMPNGKKAWENIVEADKYFRAKYNEYIDRINDVLRKIYPNVEDVVSKIDNRIAKETDPEKLKQLRWAKNQATQNKRLYPRQDYYRHFKELDDSFLSTIDGIKRGATDIDPNLVGKSEFSKPKSKFAGILQKRIGSLDYKADAVGGMLDYIQQAEYKINIEPNIVNIRGFIKDLTIETAETKNANAFIETLQNLANELSGKTNTLDRSIMNILGDRAGRATLNGITRIMNRIKANAVMGNIGTVFVQPFNLPNVLAYAQNPKDLADGMFKALKGLAGDESVKAILNKSPFLQERYMSRAFRQLDEGIIKKTENFTAWTLEALDKAVADSAFITFYKQNIKKGMSEADAIFEADELVKRSIAGRGIGEMPPAQRAKLTKALLPFTVEVRNALNVYKGQFFDLSKGVKTGDPKLISKASLALTELFAMSYLMNKIGEVALNRESILPDPIDVIISEATSEEPSVTDAMLRLVGESLSAHPAGQYIGGIGAEGMGLTEYDMKEIFGESDPTRYGTGPMLIGTLGEPIGQFLKGQDVDAFGAAMSILPKFGGRQIERSVRGLQDMAVLPKEHINTEGVSIAKQDFPASYSRGGNLRFTIDKTPMNYLRAGTTGTWSTKEGKNYIDQKNKPLGDKQEEAVTKLGGSPEVERFVREFPKIGVDQQRKLIFNSNYKDHEKAILDRTLINSSVKPDYSSKDNYEFSLLRNETKQKYIGLANAGISKRVFMDTIANADTNNSGRVNKDEAIAYLDSQKFLTKKQKELLWPIISTAKNPYA
jgi:hypothetical protein